MAVRKIVRIDEELCDGCGLCVPACAEGAIQIIDGKARLVSEMYCDGLGSCLGECPQGAITIEERQAEDFDPKAVETHLASLKEEPTPQPLHHAGCPGAAMRQLKVAPAQAAADSPRPSQLGQWPVQLMLVPPTAPFLKDADILLCADCVPFAVADFHERFLTGRALLVGCPKLDDLQHYYEKLKVILTEARPKRLTVMKMEVPCCNGIAQIALKARQELAPDLPVDVITIGIDGRTVEHNRDLAATG